MKNILFTFFSFFIILNAFSQQSWVSYNDKQAREPEYNILEQDSRGLTLEIRTFGFFTEDIIADGTTYQSLEMLAYQKTLEVGKPELPALNQIIGIPAHRLVKAEIIDSEQIELNGEYNIFPCQEPEKDIKNGKPAFSFDAAVYFENEAFPSKQLTMNKPGIWRDVKISGLRFIPFSYNTKSKKLTAINRVKIRVEFYGSDFECVPLRSVKQINPRHYNMYANKILNFESLGFEKTYREEYGTKYLIITNTNPTSTIQQFVNWKNEQGYNVEVKTLMSGFNQPQQFKTYIQQLYQSDGLEYVLLVGDGYPDGGSGGGPDIVPLYYWNPGSNASYSDSWYTCLDGPDDHYADLAIGRFVYDDLTELSQQMQKTMDHYFNPEIGSWAENSLLVAHKEQYPNKYTGCKEEIRNYGYTIQTPNFTTCYGGAGASNNDIVSFINNNSCGILNYRGHGSATEFWEWCNEGSFTNTHIQQLTNSGRLFVLFDVCCDNMDIVEHPGDCLCESFMKSPVAAVAINGAIIPSYTTPNHDYDKEMYKAVFNEGISNIGYVTNYANITVLNNHGSSGESNARTYLWLGDASLQPWTKQPANLNVTHDDYINIGQQYFEVTVTGPAGYVNEAMVCISNANKTVYGVAYTNASGYAEVQLESPVQQVENLKLSVSAFNHLPSQESLQVNGLPGKASMPVPENEAIHVNPFASLHWSEGNGGIPNEYKIYLGTDDPPSNIVNGESVFDTLYQAEDDFDFETEYFWRVDSYNSFGSATGNVWSFTIGEEPNEDFESGDFGSNGWYFAGDAEWLIDNENSRHGNYSAQSGALETGQASSLLIDLEAESFFTVPIVFWMKLSSLEGENKLQMIIDGEVKEEWSGEIEWTKETFFVTSGLHTFEWKYIKNAAAGTDQDCAWIDFITFPPSSPTVNCNAGPDGDICETDAYQLNGSAENYDSLLWTSSGDGVFDDPEQLNPLYTAGENDILNGQAGLSLTAYKDDDETSDEMMLSIFAMPEVYAGEDMEVCSGNDFYAATATGINSKSLLWTSEGDGSFNYDTLLYTTYTPGPQDITNGSVILNLSAEGFSTCASVSDDIAISLISEPGQPERPSGPETVDVYYTQSTDYQVNEVVWADDYIWQLSPQDAGDITANTNTATIVWDENYLGAASLFVKASNQCGESSFSEGLSITVYNTVGIKDASLAEQILIVPNPNSGAFRLFIPQAVESSCDILLYNLIGTIVYSSKNVKLVDNYHDISVDNIPDGIYLLRINTAESSFVKRMIVK